MYFNFLKTIFINMPLFSFFKSLVIRILFINKLKEKALNYELLISRKFFVKLVEYKFISLDY